MERLVLVCMTLWWTLGIKDFTIYFFCRPINNINTTLSASAIKIKQRKRVKQYKCIAQFIKRSLTINFFFRRLTNRLQPRSFPYHLFDKIPLFHVPYIGQKIISLKSLTLFPPDASWCLVGITSSGVLTITFPNGKNIY